METARILEVLEICLPVFAVLGLGKVLGLKGFIQPEHCGFINKLVYTISLPALIFNAVARQTFKTFLDPAVVAAPLAAVVLIALLTMGIARLCRFKGPFAAAFVFGTFWANATYVGFPLCINAYGELGEAKAAVYNAFIVPFFIVFGYLLIGFYGDERGRTSIGGRIKTAFMNPILISALVGIVFALTLDRFRSPAGELEMAAPLLSAGTLIGSFLKMVGSMGLPLALLSIGASLKWEQSRTQLLALSWTIGCKLLLLPLVTLLLIRWFLPAAPPASQGVAVILSGAPMAVASYVISCQLGIERSFIGTMLVLSTALSVFTIPVWIYVLKGF